MKTVRLFLFVALLTAASASTDEAKEDDLTSSKKLGTIYLDQTYGHDESSGKTFVVGDVGGLIVSELQKLGFEVVTYQGVRPKSAKLSIAYGYKWMLDSARLPYLGSFDATLLDEKQVIGHVTYHAPALRERGERLPDNFHDVIGPIITDLMHNFEPNRLFPAGFAGPELRPLHPSELLPPFSIYEANKINKALSGVKFPITRQDLIERVGGKDGVYLNQSAALQTADHLYGVVDYALSDINNRQGYFFLELVLEGPPKNEESDKVKAAFLMFNARGVRFAQAPDQPMVLRKKPGVNEKNDPPASDSSR